MYTHIKGIRACSWTWWLWPISVDLFFLFLDVPPALSLSPRGLCFFITLLRTLRPNSPVAALTCISCVFFLTPSSFFLDLNPRDNFLMSRCLKKKKKWSDTTVFTAQSWLRVHDACFEVFSDVFRHHPHPLALNLLCSERAICPDLSQIHQKRRSLLPVPK